MTFNLHFVIDPCHLQQVQGTAMGFPVSVVIANVVMEQRALRTFAHSLRVWKICG